MNRNRQSAPDAGKPMLDTCTDAQFSLGGELGWRIEAVTRQWILPAPYANPGMLEMFRHRDRKPVVADGTRVRLCDFASAGMAGSAYAT